MARLTTKCMTSWLNNHHAPSWFFIFGGDSLGMANCLERNNNTKCILLSTGYEDLAF